MDWIVYSYILFFVVCGEDIKEEKKSDFITTIL